MQLKIFSPSASLSALVAGQSCIVFSGSRSPGSQAFYSCSQLLPVIQSFSGAVGVGCASGIDQLIRSVFPSATVFSVQQPISRASFAKRSQRLLLWGFARSGLLIAFPSGPASPHLCPSRSFKGYGSGSWGSVAFAIGWGLPVLLVLPIASMQAFPAPSVIRSHFSYFGPAPCGGALWLSQPAQTLLTFQ